MYQTAKPIPVVSLLDAALDTQAMGKDLKEYRKTRDPKYVKEKPGMKLTWYHVKRISSNLMENVVMAATTEAQKYARAFQCAIVQVDNLVDVNGQVYRAPFQPRSQMMAQTGGPITCLDEEEMELFAPVVKQEIGCIAWDLSFLDPRIKQDYRLSPSLHYALTGRMLRDAEETMAEKIKIKESLEAQQKAKPSEDGAKPTDAHATGKAKGSRKSKTARSKGSNK